MRVTYLYHRFELKGGDSSKIYHRLGRFDLYRFFVSNVFCFFAFKSTCDLYVAFYW